jgi:hypothetical protein
MWRSLRLGSNVPVTSPSLESWLLPNMVAPKRKRSAAGTEYLSPVPYWLAPGGAARKADAPQDVGMPQRPDVPAAAKEEPIPAGSPASFGPSKDEKREETASQASSEWWGSRWAPSPAPEKRSHAARTRSPVVERKAPVASETAPPAKAAGPQPMPVPETASGASSSAAAAGSSAGAGSSTAKPTYYFPYQDIRVRTQEGRASMGLPPRKGEILLFGDDRSVAGAAAASASAEAVPRSRTSVSLPRPVPGGVPKAAPTGQSQARSVGPPRREPS